MKNLLLKGLMSTPGNEIKTIYIKLMPSQNMIA